MDLQEVTHAKTRSVATLINGPENLQSADTVTEYGDKTLDVQPQVNDALRTRKQEDFKRRGQFVWKQ